MKRPLLALVFALAGATSPAIATTPFDETRPLKPEAEVRLDNLKGSITVGTWERPEIRIEGTRGEGTEGLSIEGDADRLAVKIEYPERSGWFGNFGPGGGESELRVTLPAGVSLRVDTVAARIEVRGVAGRELAINTVSGDSVVATGAAELDFKSVSGDARIEASSAEVEVESVSGDVELRGALTGRIGLESVSGRLTLDSSGAAKHVGAGVVSGDVSLRTALQDGARLSAESLSGDVELILPAATSASVNVSTFSGSIRSDHGTVQTPEYGPGSSLRTTLGAGAARIELESFSGDVRLRLE